MAAGRKILIVDDDASLRQALAEQLELHEEFKVAQAENANVALDQVKQGYFDAILLDVGLPDMDGRELCRMIKSNELTANAKVILMSGLSTVEMSKEGLQADEMLRKPVKFEALQSALNNVLGVTS